MKRNIIQNNKFTSGWIVLLRVCCFIALPVLLGFMLCVSTSAASNSVDRVSCIDFIMRSSSVNCDAANTSVLDAFGDAQAVLAAKYAGYANAEETIEYMKKSISAAVEHGVIKGYDDGTLGLDNNITRAEFACMLYRVRDYYKAPSRQISYNGTYSDLSDWNENEVLYCIENGFLMGYGDIFGSNDPITYEQLGIVRDRLSYGLTTREKYSLLNICEQCPISFNEILISASDEELAAYEPSVSENEREGLPPAQAAKKLENLFEIYGNMDYERLKDEAYKSMLISKFKGQGGYSSTPVTITDEAGDTTIEEVISLAESAQVVRESICVFSPVSSRNVFFFAPGSYEKTVGAGYEYFCYASGTPISALPEGIEAGIWYKRKIEVTFWEYKSASSQYAHLIVEAGKCEFS